MQRTYQVLTISQKWMSQGFRILYHHPKTLTQRMCELLTCLLVNTDRLVSFVPEVLMSLIETPLTPYVTDTSRSELHQVTSSTSTNVTVGIKNVSNTPPY